MYGQLLNGTQESEKEPFLAVAGGVDARLPRQLTKDFKNGFAARWGKDASKFRNYAQVIYVFFRN
jgi:hypothetical protein